MAPLILAMTFLSGTAFANPHLTRGIEFLEKLEDRQAVEEFDQALQVGDLSPAKRARVLVYRGVAFANLLEDAKARQSFKQALTLDPAVALPPAISPKISKMFGEVRVALLRRPPEPPQAEQGAAPAAQDVDLEGRSDVEKRNWLAWSLLGLATVACGTAIVLGLYSRVASDKAADLNLSYGKAKDYQERAEGFALGANVLFGVAAAAAVSSAVLFYLGYRERSRQHKLAIGPASLASGGAWGIAVRGTSW